MQRGGNSIAAHHRQRDRHLERVPSRMVKTTRPTPSLNRLSPATVACRHRARDDRARPRGAACRTGTRRDPLVLVTRAAAVTLSSRAVPAARPKRPKAHGACCGGEACAAASRSRSPSRFPPAPPATCCSPPPFPRCCSACWCCAARLGGCRARPGESSAWRRRAGEPALENARGKRPVREAAVALGTSAIASLWYRGVLAQSFGSWADAG